MENHDLEWPRPHSKLKIKCLMITTPLKRNACWVSMLLRVKSPSLYFWRSLRLVKDQSRSDSHSCCGARINPQACRCGALEQTSLEKRTAYVQGGYKSLPANRQLRGWGQGCFHSLQKIQRSPRTIPQLPHLPALHWAKLGWLGPDKVIAERVFSKDFKTTNPLQCNTSKLYPKQPNTPSTAAPVWFQMSRAPPAAQTVKSLSLPFSSATSVQWVSNWMSKLRIWSSLQDS